MLIQILDIQPDAASWIMDAVRLVFWLIAKASLIWLDGMFIIINDIWKFKFFDNTYVNNIYSAATIVACTWLGLKVIIEIIMRYFVNQEDNSSPTRIFKGIIFGIAMMFLIPYLFNWGYDVSSRLTQYVISASSSAETSPTSFEASMSSMILTAFADDNKMTEEDKKYFIENWWSADYNEVVDDGLFNSGKYKYSFNTFPIFLVGLVVVILLIFIGVQVAKRIIELALYKAIAPFVCTSLVSNRSHAFEVWVKGVMGAFLITAVQYLCIGILFNVFGSVVKGTEYAMSVILIIIGALLFIVSSPQLVSALLNANVGTLSNMNELHSIVALGASMVAMSKYGKTADNSNNSNTNVDNSTSSNTDPPNGSDPNGPNLDQGNSSLNVSDDISSQENNSNDNNSISSSNISPAGSDLSFNTSNMDINHTTSLADRIETYKDITGTNYSSDDDLSSMYKLTIDWSDTDVFNTKEH